MLDERLPGITIGKSRRSFEVVAYADDVTVFIARLTDFDIVWNALQYEKATGDRLNPTKSKALAIGKCPVPVTALGIEICIHTKMLESPSGHQSNPPPKKLGSESSAQCGHKHVTPMQEILYSTECNTCNNAYWQTSGT
jgi:hypothetical protein